MTSTLRVPVEDDLLLSPDQLAAATEDQLVVTAAAIAAEQHRRALLGNDLPAVVERAFEDGFNGRGEPHAPFLVDALLICPGSKRSRSKSSHDCTFVSIEGTWVWDAPALVFDEMRDVPGTHAQKRSVSVVGAEEGMKLDLVTSSSRGGGSCEMKTAVSYEISHGQLVQVATRARKPDGHR